MRESQPPKLVAFGDSLTQFGFDEGGWLARLSNAYQRRLDVVNRGFSGYNTEWAKTVLPAVLRTERVALFTVWFGANDATLPPWPQHVPVPEYKRNLETILGMINSTHPHVPIVLLSPINVNERVLEEQYAPTKALLEGKLRVGPLDGSRSSGTLNAYHTAWLETECAPNVFKLDLRDEVKNSGLLDGIHLNAEGNRIVYEAVAKCMQERMGLSAQNLPLWGDDWKDKPAVEWAYQYQHSA